MMRFRQLVLSFLLLLPVACGPSTIEPVDEPADVPVEEAPDDALRLAPTATGSGAAAPESAPAEEAYPIPVPSPVPIDEGYPAVPPTSPPPSPYPVTGDPVWVLHPVGEQCSDESIYPDETTAVAALTAAGITVYESEVTELIVCSACGCPTSAHYRISIDSGQLGAARALNWTVEQ